jgi:IS30 family transposase
MAVGRKTKFESSLLTARIKELHDNGLTVEQIADSLTTMPSTVKDHLAKIESDYSDPTDRQSIKEEISKCRSKIDQLLKDKSINHLAIEKLTLREIKLLEVFHSIPNRDFTETEPTEHLPKWKLDAIADIIESGA